MVGFLSCPLPDLGAHAFFEYWEHNDGGYQTFYNLTAGEMVFQNEFTPDENGHMSVDYASLFDLSISALPMGYSWTKWYRSALYHNPAMAFYNASHPDITQAKIDEYSRDGFVAGVPSGIDRPFGFRVYVYGSKKQKGCCDA